MRRTCADLRRTRGAVPSRVHGVDDLALRGDLLAGPALDVRKPRDEARSRETRLSSTKMPRATTRPRCLRMPRATTMRNRSETQSSEGRSTAPAVWHRSRMLRASTVPSRTKKLRAIATAPLETTQGHSSAGRHEDAPGHRGAEPLEDAQGLGSAQLLEDAHAHSGAERLVECVKMPRASGATAPQGNRRGPRPHQRRAARGCTGPQRRGAARGWPGPPRRRAAQGGARPRRRGAARGRPGTPRATAALSCWRTAKASAVWSAHRTPGPKRRGAAR